MNRRDLLKTFAALPVLGSIPAVTEAASVDASEVSCAASCDVVGPSKYAVIYTHDPAFPRVLAEMIDGQLYWIGEGGELIPSSRLNLTAS